jgi:antitoxin (DNA-binding transcriptional repressor) of toxin-antitoxin stability system
MVTVHGEPAAELRPVSPVATGIEARIDELRRRGIITLAPPSRRPITVGRKRPGALKRFIASGD